MNKSNIEHAAYAIMFQAVIGLVSGDWLAGGLFSVGFFVAREHAQREYRLTHGASVKGLRPWSGFTGWTRDAMLDAGCPAVAVTAVYSLITFGS